MKRVCDLDHLTMFINWWGGGGGGGGWSVLTQHSLTVQSSTRFMTILHYGLESPILLKSVMDRLYLDADLIVKVTSCGRLVHRSLPFHSADTFIQSDL